MNITREFQHYTNTVKNTFSSKFKLKTELYTPLNHCSKLLMQIGEVEGTISALEKGRSNLK